MASTATPLRATAHTDLRRGNHPAGRALSRLTPVGPGERAVDHLAEVVPLRRAEDVVVPLRLTRRGRLVLSGLGVVISLALAVVAGPALVGGADAPALELAGRSSVVVHSGDTLWSIALSVAPDSDPRAVVDALQTANGLDDTRLVPGQVLVLP